MARVSGRMVMTGDRDGEFAMNVEFSDAKEAHPLRSGGYYVGHRTIAEMIEELTKRASTTMDESKPDVTGNVGDGATGSGDEVRTVDSQSSTEFLKVSTPGSSLMDTARVGDPPTGTGFCRAEHSLEEEILIKEEEIIKEEGSKKEEDSFNQRITCKEEDTTEQEDFKKEEDSFKREINLKEEHIKKEEDAKIEVYSLKGEFTVQEEHTKKVLDSSEEEDTSKEGGSGKGVSAKEEGSGREGSGNELSGRSPSVVEVRPHLESYPDKYVSGPLRPDLSSADEVEKEVDEVNDYFVFDEDESTPVSLCLLPLELEEGKTIGGSGSTKVLSLHGKSVGVDIMWSISAWKLMFLENASFQVLVKMAQKGDVKWIKLGGPRSRCKETLEDVFLVAKVLALLKKEPQASEDRVWHHLLEGDVAPETLRDHLCMRCSLMEQFINLDPILKEANARKTLLNLLDREKEANSGKRVLSDRDSSDEIENRSVKKFKTGNVVYKNEKPAVMVGVTSNSIPEDVDMGEFDGEEEYYDEGEGDESDEEFGDSCCIICDDGGILLCCDGPCMRSFHATTEHGLDTQCTTLGFTDAVVARLVGKWLCKNCKYNQHQCYVCGELGSGSNEDLGARQEVFVCNVACCGRFYHPKCIANRLTVDPSAKETLAENIQAGKESFTCPLHACNECGEGENKDVSDLILVKCRRCPIAWHKKCLPSTILFEDEAKRKNEFIRAWAFGEKKTQLICYCTDHKIIASLGTPSRKHLNFGLSPEEKEESEKQKKKVSPVMKEPARYGTKTFPVAASMGKSAGKKYRSTELIVKPRPDRLIGSSSVPPPKPRISKDAVKTCEEAAERIVDFIVTQSKLKVTEDSVKSKHESSLPGIYKPKRNGFMKMGMVSSILEGAKAAVEKVLLARHVEAMTICDKKTVQTVMHEEERLRTYLAPTLFGKRYTSYGRHFTKLQKLEKVVEILQPYIWDRDTIVDFSCGDNSFCRLFREALSETRKTNCQFKNFDIFPSKDAFGFEQKDWLQVGLKDCGPGENLVIGLNPPFAFVEKFVSHALGMNPRLLVLIVPPMKKNLEHLGYECLVDDGSLMAEKSFYLPGSVNEKSSECLEQGNNVAPHFFIYCHKKFVGRYKGAVPVPPEGLLTANRSSMSRKIEMPAKLSPPSEPTASLFIPSVQSRPLPSQVPGKVAAPRNRDPRQYLGVSSSVSRPVGADAPEEGELLTPQSHVPFRNNPRPVWQNNLPPPPYPPHLHSRPMHPRLQPGSPYHTPHPFLPHHHHPGEYSPFDPGMFPHGRPYLGLPPPVRPSQNGFQRGPRPEEFFPGPSPSRHADFRPEDDNGYGGWIDG